MKTTLIHKTVDIISLAIIVQLSVRRALTNKTLGVEQVSVDGKRMTLYTENKMFRDLAKHKEVKKLLNPGAEVNKTAQQRYNEYKAKREKAIWDRILKR
ncbi:MAG: hypothetical protein EOO43_12560 [Flavobacterium sp.]|nr:MAG: hypothetical protein EOO43_12560 [Flavobacterium sp.]